MTLALLILLQTATQDTSAYDDPGREVQWARTFDHAFQEARARNVPVLVFLTSDN